MDQLELPALFVVTLAESAGIPLPLPYYLLLVYAGIRHRSSLWAGVTAVAACCLAITLGAFMLFALIRCWGPPFARKSGRYLGRSLVHVDRTQAWFTRHRRSAVFVGRLIPGLETSTTAVAGIMRVPWTQFLVSAGAAAVITSTAYYSIGSLFGDVATRLITRMATYHPAAPLWAVFVGATLLLASACLWARHRTLTRR